MLKLVKEILMFLYRLLGKRFQIPYTLTSDVVNRSDFTWVKTIISTFWYYVFGRYILLDIIDKFEKIQTGNIENLENENIKKEML